MQTTLAVPQPANFKAELFSLAVNLSGISNPTLARLLDEVKNNVDTKGDYDRVHNRHNR
jgi:hypothetical protein